MRSKSALHIHFETRAGKPSVFRITEPLIAAAKARSQTEIITTLGVDLADISWLPHVNGLVTSNDVIIDPKSSVAPPDHDRIDEDRTVMSECRGDSLVEYARTRSATCSFLLKL